MKDLYHWGRIPILLGIPDMEIIKHAQIQVEEVSQKLLTHKSSIFRLETDQDSSIELIEAYSRTLQSLMLLLAQKRHDFIKRSLTITKLKLQEILSEISEDGLNDDVYEKSLELACKKILEQ